MVKELPAVAGPVLQPVALAFVAGQRVGIEEWSLDREINSGYPQRLVAGSGITAATGEMVLEPGAAVMSTVMSLVNPARPVRAGQTARLDVGYASTGLTRALTGWVNTVGQGLSEGALRVGLIDDVDRFDRSISHEAILDVMPPAYGFTAPRSVGVRPEYLVDYALRRSAWYATPQPRGTVAVHAPLMGSAWAHTGAVNDSSGYGDPASVGWASVPCAWGYCLEFGQTSYKPAATLYGTGTIEATVCVDLDKHTTEATLELGIGSDRVSVAVGPQGVQARFNSEVRASLPAGARQIITLRLEAGAWTLADDQGRTAATTQTLAGALTSVAVSAPHGSAIGGIGVTRPPQGEVLYPVRSWVRTAFLDVGQLHEPLICMPDIETTTVGQTLAAISEALLASMWIDDSGNFHWVHPDRLRSGVPVKELTPKAALLDYELKDLLSSRISTTTVVGRTPQVSRASKPTRTVWQGSGETIAPGEDVTYLIESGDDEEWIGVAGPALLKWDETYKTATATFVGGSRPAGDDEVLATSGVGWDWSKVSPGTWKLVVSNMDKELRLIQHVPSDAGFKKWAEGDSLPIVRAQARVAWVEERTTSLIAGSGQRDYEHPGDVWVQRKTHRQRLADYLASFLQEGIPEVEGIEIIPDYSLQLGDHIKLLDTEISDVVVHGVVSGIRMAGKGPDVSMSLTIAVLTAKQYSTQVSQPRTGVVANVDRSMRPRTVSQVDTDGGA